MLAIALTSCSSSAFDVAAPADAVVDSNPDSNSVDTNVEDSAVVDSLIEDTAPDEGITLDAEPVTGGALELDGTGHGVLSASAGAYASTGFSWEMWFRPDVVPIGTEIGRTQMLMVAAGESLCEDITLGFGSEKTAARELTFSVDGGGDCAVRNLTPTTFVPPGGFVKGKWYHLVAVRDYFGKKVGIFLDGALAKAETYDRAPITRELKVVVGRFWDGLTQSAYFKGAIDELRIYNRPLTFGEVAAHYNSGKGTAGLPTEPGLVAGFHLDEFTGFVAKDYSVAMRTFSFAGGVKLVPGIVPRP